MADDFDKYRAEVLQRWDKASVEEKITMWDEAVKAKILGDPNSIGEQMSEIRERSEQGAPVEGDEERWNQLAAMVPARDNRLKGIDNEMGKDGRDRLARDLEGW